MARTVKTGLEYFPFDIDFFQDLRIRKLIKYQGGKAVTVYALLLCIIYKDGYYIRWDNELPFVISEQTGYDEAYIQEVINCCLNIGLFSKELFKAEGVMTSKGIQERYMNINRLCKRTATVSEYNLLDYKPKVEGNPKPVRKKKVQAESPAMTVEPTQAVYTLTLEQEIEQLKKDESWLDGLRQLHSVNIEQLRNSLDEFKVQCVADGKERHQSMQDAKQHFNSWLRIVINKNKKQEKDVTVRSERRNQRRAHVLSADETKEYGGSF